MAKRKLSKDREYAKILYTQMGLTQKEIAQRVGVTEKTIGRWKNDPDDNWDDLKTVFTTTRTNIVKNLQRQMELWQKEIGNNKLADSKEVDILVKLASAVRKLETDTGIAEIVDTGIKFINFLQEHNPKLSKETAHWFDLFIKNKI